MSHFARTQTTAVWTVGGAGNYVTLLADWQSLCDKVFASINGDLGGCWAPSSLITINTAGLKVSGPASVDYGGKLKTTSGARFVLGAGDWPKLGPNHVGRKRSLRQDLMARMSTPRYHWASATNYIGSIQTIACTVQGTAGLEQPKCTIPLRVHDGARLTGATLTFRVPTSRALAPVEMPKVRLTRTDRDGNLVPMQSVARGADADGWVSMPKATSGSAWYAGGAAQTFEIACDQNNSIDTATYLYWAEIQEEAGTRVVLPDASTDGAVIRARKANVTWAATTWVAISGNPNPVPDEAGISGVPTLVTGDSVLFAQSALPTQNGIWIVNTGGAWTRRNDLSVGADFTPGFLVQDTYSWNTWELVSPIAVQPIKVGQSSLVTGDTPVTFQRRRPRGNVYHALMCNFDSILDMRPQ